MVHISTITGYGLKNEKLMNPEISLCVYLKRKNVDYVRTSFDESTSIFSFSTKTSGGIQGIVVSNNSATYKVYKADLEFETTDLNSLNPYFIQTVILNQLPIYSTI